MSPVKWTDIVDRPGNNSAYFSHISEDRYDQNNPIYKSLNMNMGDKLDLSNLSRLNRLLPYDDIGNFSGNGEEIYNEATRIIHKNESRISGRYKASDLIDVKSRGFGLSSQISTTNSQLSSNFEQTSPGVYIGEFLNESLNINFQITLQDGGSSEVGTSFMGIYRSIHRSRMPNQLELAVKPYAFSVTLPTIIPSSAGKNPLLMSVDFQAEKARNDFFDFATKTNQE